MVRAAAGGNQGVINLDLEILLPPGCQKDGNVVAVVLSFFAVWKHFELEVEVLGLSSVSLHLMGKAKEITNLTNMERKSSNTDL